MKKKFAQLFIPKKGKKMKKITSVFALLAVLLFSGCTQQEEITTAMNAIHTNLCFDGRQNITKSTVKTELHPKH